MKNSELQNFPKPIGILGYGAIGKAFVDMLKENHPEFRIVVRDVYDLNPQGEFEYIKSKLTAENASQTFDDMKLTSGDIFVDLSCGVNFRALWKQCISRNIAYINSALERWEGEDTNHSFAQNEEEQYETSILFDHDEVKSEELYKKKGTSTAIFEMGCNPGLISHFVKQGLEDATKYALENPDFLKSFNKELALKADPNSDKYHSQLAQALGVHTIHCSEKDRQFLQQDQIPKDMNKKFYNTWSCQGFLTEGLISIEAARGSHEDKQVPGFTNLRDRVFMTNYPSVRTWARSYVPNEETRGALIPHGEAHTIRDYLQDHQTGYSPSLYFVYDYNPYARQFIYTLTDENTVDNTLPEFVVMQPMNFPSLRGYDKIGGLIIMNENKAWWTGSIMDDIDASKLFEFKYGPTVIQVAAGVYAGFKYIIENPKIGTVFTEQCNTQRILTFAKPYLGRFYSGPINLEKTLLKDKKKFQDFLCQQPALDDIS